MDEWGELVKTLTTATPGLGESHWTKVESASEGFTFTWSDLQKVVIISNFPSPTPSVTKIAKGAISVLIGLLPTLMMKLTLAFPHGTKETSQVKSCCYTMQSGEQADREAHGWSSKHPQRMIAVIKELQWAHLNNQKWMADAEMMVVTSCKRSKRH